MSHRNDGRSEGFEGQEMATCECGVETPYNPKDLTPLCSDCRPKLKVTKHKPEGGVTCFEIGWN